MDTKAIASRVAAREMVAGKDVTKEKWFQHLAKSAMRTDRTLSSFNIERLIVRAQPSGIRLAIHLETLNGKPFGYVEAEYKLSKLSEHRT